jgi:hypothetical protein
MPSEVFISFIHEEEPVAEGVAALLETFLAPVFRASDRFDVVAGERWLDRIESELKAARVCVAMLSPQSVARPWVNFESGAIWIRGVPVIPVCFGGLVIDRLPKPYSNFQAVQLPDDARYLLASVAHHLGKDYDKVAALTGSLHEESWKRCLARLDEALAGG